MKFSIKFSWVLLFFPVVMSGCFRKVNHIQLEEPPHKAVMSSMLKAGDSVHVFLAHLTGVFDFEMQDAYVCDARIILMEDGREVDTLDSCNQGFYHSGQIVQPGATYRLHADAGNYGSLTATTKVPATVPVQVHRYEILNYQNDTIVKMVYRIDDPPMEGDAYMFELFGNNNAQPEHPILMRPLERLPVDPRIEADPVGTHLFVHDGQGWVLSDQYFNGNTVYVSIYYGLRAGYYQADTLFPRWHRMDGNYYEYLRYTLVSGNMEDGGPYSSMEYENPHGNVEGGYGFVGSERVKTDTVVIR